MTASKNWLPEQYLPVNTIGYCHELWQNYQFTIKITPPRKTKLGDYRYRPNRNTHEITINNNLNKYAFLLVYLHEVAHCATCIEFGPKVKPHGSQWQRQMQKLISPLLDQELLPPDVRLALVDYLKAPGATSCTSPALTRALRRYDPESTLTPLEQLPIGSEFTFQSKNYQKIKVRRTRVVCKDMVTNRTWLIPKLALVEP